MKRNFLSPNRLINVKYSRFQLSSFFFMWYKCVGFSWFSEGRGCQRQPVCRHNFVCICECVRFGQWFMGSCCWPFKWNLAFGLLSQSTPGPLQNPPPYIYVDVQYLHLYLPIFITIYLASLAFGALRLCASSSCFNSYLRLFINTSGQKSKHVYMFMAIVGRINSSWVCRLDVRWQFYLMSPWQFTYSIYPVLYVPII